MSNILGFLNWPKKKKVLITESTKSMVEEVVGEKLDEMTEEEVVIKINKTKRAVAKVKENGEIQVKRSING